MKNLREEQRSLPRGRLESRYRLQTMTSNNSLDGSAARNDLAMIRQRMRDHRASVRDPDGWTDGR